MSTFTEEDLNRKVNKLLTQAEATNHPAEADAFMAKAQALITQYALDELVVRGYTEEEFVTEYLDNYGKFYNGWGDLLSGIASANDCKLVWCHGEYFLKERRKSDKFSTARVTVRDGEGNPVLNPAYMKTGGVLSVSGYRSDVRHVLSLFASLKVQGEREFLRDKKPQGVHGTTWKTQWLDGFAGKIRARLWEANRAAMAEKKAAMEESEAGSSDNLPVLVAEKKDKVREYHDTYWGKLTNRSRASRSFGSGYTAGAAAGGRVSLGNGALGSTRSLPR